MLGSQFRFHLAYTSTTSPVVISSLVNADGTNATGAPAVSINDINANLTLSDELKDVTEAGNPNTINTTTRRVARQGVQSSEITTISRDLSAQFVYEPHTAFNTPEAGYEVLDLLEYLEETKSAIFVIDIDKVLGTDGAKGSGANYTVGLSQPREVEGQVVYDVTFALKSFAQRVEWDNTGGLWRAKVNP